MQITGIVQRTGKSILNRAFGVMTQRQMLASTTKAARSFERALVKNGGSISSELAGKIVSKALPKGVKSPIVTTSVETAKKFMEGTGIFSKEQVSTVFSCVGGIHIPNLKTGKTLLWVSNDSHVLAHEFRHYLDSSATIPGKIKKIITKFNLSNPKCEKTMKRLSPKVQNVYKDIEESIIFNLGGNDPRSILGYAPTKQGLLEMLGVSEQELTKFLNVQANNAMGPFGRKSRIGVLKGLIFSMQSEVNAYNSGAKITRAIDHIKPNESCGADMISLFHSETVKALKAKLKEQRALYYKSKIGLEKMPLRIRKQSVEFHPSSELQLFSPCTKEEDIIFGELISEHSFVKDGSEITIREYKSK